MMAHPNMVFSEDPEHGLIARSGWDQVEARVVLLDLGWEWSDERHALVPPDDVSAFDAGVAAVEQLHLYGHVQTGYVVEPFGTMPLSVVRAEHVFARTDKEVLRDPSNERTVTEKPASARDEVHVEYGREAIADTEMPLCEEETPTP